MSSKANQPVDKEFLLKEYEKENAIISRLKTDELAWISIFLLIHGWLITSLSNAESDIFQQYTPLIIVQVGIFLIYGVWLWQLSNIRHSYYATCNRCNKVRHRLENGADEAACEKLEESLNLRTYIKLTQPFNTAGTIIFLNTSVTMISSAIVLFKIGKICEQQQASSIIINGCTLAAILLLYFMVDYSRMKKIYR